MFMITRIEGEQGAVWGDDDSAVHQAAAAPRQLGWIPLAGVQRQAEQQGGADGSGPEGHPLHAGYMQVKWLGVRSLTTPRYANWNSCM